MKFENLITLINTVSGSKLTGFKYEEEGVKIELSKKEGKVQVVSAQTVAPTAEVNTGGPSLSGMEQGAWNSSEKTAKENGTDEPEGNLVVSPLVGTFYAAPSEGAEPFVTVGDSVKKGQTLAIVEAMKLMNDIESDYDGTIAEVLVENGQPVEYGQPLFRVK